MSNLDEVNQFKRDLKNYKSYSIRIEYLAVLLSTYEYLQIGVRGINFEKEPSTSKVDRGETITKYTPKIDLIKRRIDVIQGTIDYIDMVLNAMDEDDRKIITDIYINNLSYPMMAIKTNYSESGLKKKVNTIIKKALSTLY